jgi:hypothetical protein
MGIECSKHGKRNAYRILVVKPEGKRPLGRTRYNWEYNIKIDLREIGWGGIDFVDLVHDSDQWKALVYTAIKCQLS